MPDDTYPYSSLEEVCGNLFNLLGPDAEDKDLVKTRKDCVSSIRAKLKWSVTELADALRITEQALYKVIRGDQSLGSEPAKRLLGLSKIAASVSLTIGELDLHTWTEIEEELLGENGQRTIYVFSLRQMPIASSELMQQAVIDRLMASKETKMVYIFPRDGRAHESYKRWVSRLEANVYSPEQVKPAETETGLSGQVFAFYTSEQASGEIAGGKSLEAFQFASNMIIGERLVDGYPCLYGFTSVPLSTAATAKLREFSRRPTMPGALWSRVDPAEMDLINLDIADLGRRCPGLRVGSQPIPKFILKCNPSEPRDYGVGWSKQMTQTEGSSVDKTAGSGR